MSERIPMTESEVEEHVRNSADATRARIAKLEAREMRRRENPTGDTYWQRAYADLLRNALAEAWANLARLEVEPS